MDDHTSHLKKILVVDDEINVCKSIKQAIIHENYDIDTALSGEEALEKDAEKSYDLIITDLMMPGISGLDLLKALKSRRPDIMVIMVTGYPTIKTAVESIRVGAFDYIPKPFTPNELRSLVSRAFKKHVEEEISEPVMPAGLHYMIGHTWLSLDRENIATVGLVYDFLRTVNRIINIEQPRINQAVNQGEVCAKLEDEEKNIHRIWAPASGRVLDINPRLRDNPSLLKSAPYTEGWLFKIAPINLEEDLKGLVKS